jgi:phenylacetate-CoA ligase
MARFNRFAWLTGFQIQLFERIDLPTIHHLVDEINRFRPKMFLVFPSPMNMIADAIRRHRLPLRHYPQLINVSGETFFDCQRNNIQEVFAGSQIEDSYGSVELGEIAHQAVGGLEIFANVAYVETAPNEQGQPEMICTRLHLTDFPFIRYRMKDIADIEFQTRDDGQQRYIVTRIEGKDTNFILSDSGQQIYPSYFNQLVNQVNADFQNQIVEIKVYERAQRELEIRLIAKSDRLNEEIARELRRRLRTSISERMNYEIRFVDFMDHDYRRKYRVIERIGDVEYAGGIVGDHRKMALVQAAATPLSRYSLKGAARDREL